MDNRQLDVVAGAELVAEPDDPEPEEELDDSLLDFSEPELDEPPESLDAAFLPDSRLSVR